MIFILDSKGYLILLHICMHLQVYEFLHGINCICINPW